MLVWIFVLLYFTSHLCWVRDMRSPHSWWMEASVECSGCQWRATKCFFGNGFSKSFCLQLPFCFPYSPEGSLLLKDSGSWWTTSIYSTQSANTGCIYPVPAAHRGGRHLSKENQWWHFMTEVLFSWYFWPPILWGLSNYSIVTWWLNTNFTVCSW